MFMEDIDMKKFFVLFLGFFLLAGCSSDNDSNLINYMDAKEKIINEGAVVVDVRSEDEYNQNHIGGAILLSLDNITKDSVSAIIDSKDTPIIVYCRSGNRSSQALVKLEALGYTKVYDLGSIDNWKE